VETLIIISKKRAELKFFLSSAKENKKGFSIEPNPLYN